MPVKYRKKPVIIEAMRVKKPYHAILAWINDGDSTRHAWLWYEGQKVTAIMIETLEGTMRADLGDWIIKGVAGEFYPCKPDIFDATYGLVV